MRLNGSRKVVGVLRGFDPFMNLVIDEAIEETKTGERNEIGMVVSKSFKTSLILVIEIQIYNIHPGSIILLL